MAYAQCRDERGSRLVGRHWPEYRVGLERLRHVRGRVRARARARVRVGVTVRGLRTLQSVEQTPQLMGHSLYIMSGFSSHWPSCLGVGLGVGVGLGAGVGFGFG